MHFPLSFNTFFFFLLFFFGFCFHLLRNSGKNDENNKIQNYILILTNYLSFQFDYFFFTFITFIGSCEKLQIINDNRSKNQNNFSVSMKKFPLTAIKKKRKKTATFFTAVFFPAKKGKKITLMSIKI